MRPMKRLTDKRRIIKLTLQSLPALLVAIAIVIYCLTFVPLSHDRMRRTTALVEYVSCYELTVDGRPAAWFRSLGDSLRPEEMTTVAGSNVVDRRVLTGVWVNRYEFFPSCSGRILIPAVDVPAVDSLTPAEVRKAGVLKKAVAGVQERIKQLDRKASRLSYYLSTHNVSDDGYNTMAAYSARVDSSRNDAKRLLEVLNGIGGKTQTGIRHIVKYTLVHPDETGRTVREACRDLTISGGSRFRVIQTASKSMPSDAVALYFHRWLAPTAIEGTRILTAANYGSSMPGFSMKSLRTDVYGGLITRKGGHDVPRLFAPDGSPCFTKGGRLVGITMGGAVFQAKSFKFGFNDLIE